MEQRRTTVRSLGLTHRYVLATIHYLRGFELSCLPPDQDVRMIPNDRLKFKVRDDDCPRMAGELEAAQIVDRR